MVCRNTSCPASPRPPLLLASAHPPAPQKKASLLLVGLANSGKSSILHVLHTDTIDGVAPTVGFNVERLSVSRTKLKVYDMSGQSKYVALWEHYYAEAALLVFVVDAADGGSLAEARELLHRMLAHEALKVWMGLCNDAVQVCTGDRPGAAAVFSPFCHGTHPLCALLVSSTRQPVGVPVMPHTLARRPQWLPDRSGSGQSSSVGTWRQLRRIYKTHGCPTLCNRLDGVLRVVLVPPPPAPLTPRRASPSWCT